MFYIQPNHLFLQKYDIIKLPSGCSTVGSARRLGRRGRRFKSCHPDHFLNKLLGVAQLVARSVRDAEVVSSSLITQTTSKSGVSAVVARTSGGREVASSILVPPTT